MGTSSSYGGPGDTTPLLPAWALEPVAPVLPVPPPTTAPAPPADIIPSGSPDDAPPPGNLGTAPGGAPQSTPGSRPGVPPPVIVAPPRRPATPWRAAKRRMGRVASGGGRQAIGGAARSYVRAKGGARQAARSARASRAATAAFGGFLADISRHGFGEALRRLGIPNALGKDAETVFATIVDAIAPDGARPEEAAVRQGMVDALWQLYDRLSLQDGGWEKLEAMDAAAASTALETAVVECVYSRWIQEVGIAFERKAATPQEAVRRERDVKNYIRESVRLDFAGKDVLRIDWAGAEGRTFVESKYAEAYGIFEGL
jgi:hypothetical protein